MQGSGERLELDVVVDRVLYRAERDGFAVLLVAYDPPTPDRFVAAGRIGWEAQVGEALRISGGFSEHPRFGRRFAVEGARPRVPATADGIRRFLGSGRLAGIGPRLAERLVAHFGERTLQVLEETPERALEVPGVGRTRLAEITRAFAADKEWRETLAVLHGLGLGPGLAQEIWQRLGSTTLARLRDDPYALVGEIPGVGFLTADRMAQGLGVDRDAPARLEAGLVHVLRQAADQGHVLLEAGELVRRSAQLLDVEENVVRASLADAASIRKLQAVAPTGSDEGGEEPRIYLPVLMAAEVEAAHRLRELAHAPRPPAPPPIAEPLEPGITPSPEQEAAVQLLLAAKVSLLTGGPGVGKTTVLRQVVAAYRAAGFQVALASPTGRAARRLAQAAGAPAHTLHRLFGFVPGVARRRDDTPLEADVLIIDEVSMLDLPLFLRVLRRLGSRHVLILVGDPHQLPSVGPGNVLADLLHSGGFPVARLTQIFRQAHGSRIVENAHRILRGEMPDLGGQDVEDFFFVARSDPDAGADLVQHLFLERIPARYGIDPRDGIQVLAPMHRGAVGTEALNARLQQALNGGRPSLPWRRGAFFEGDRVMMTRNDYDLGVMNGDLGVVKRVLADPPRLEVAFESQDVMVQGQALENLAPAFAITVHKSQGGEYPAVILPLYEQHHLMLRRNVLYTAVTRAKRLLVIVGTRSALFRAVSDARLARRRGELRARLQGVELLPVPPDVLRTGTSGEES